MAEGVRELTVLGEFKPFGLIAESLDGKPIDNVSDKYDYFLFDPEVTRERDEFDGIDSSASSSISVDGCDHEIFIRGNRIMWITGSRVYKRFTLSSAVIMACWCHLAHSSEAVLCILQVDVLTIFNTAGELTSVPLPGIVTSIWPLPFGLLVQQAAEGNRPTYAPLSFSAPLLNSRDTLLKRELRQSPQQIFGFSSSDDQGNSASVSSHLILNDPLEEPQPVYVDERGGLKIMKDFDERTIWTSDRVPLIASYNREKTQHSLWVAESVSTCVGEHVISSSHEAHTEVFPCQFSFRRIWQAKGYQAAATKVFVATDDDAAPIICFLLQEQKRLLSIRLHTVQINDEILFDVKADMSWSIQAVAAEPVAVTRPRAKVGLLPLMDILVLDSENNFFLYSGKQCLCKYTLPLFLGNHQLKETINPPKRRFIHNVKIIGLADGVGARVNVILSNGQMLRCSLRRSPSCSLANDCITAMAEGLNSSFYNQFLQFFWGNCETADLSKANSGADEWKSFESVIMQIYRKSQSTSQPKSVLVSGSSWEFLVKSEFHKNYCNRNFFPGISTEGLDDRLEDHVSSSKTEEVHSPDGLFSSKFQIECLDSLHAVYENLKLINLRKRDLEHLAVLLCEIANILGEESYIDHYVRDFPILSKIIRRNRTSSPRSPPSLYRWLESCLLHGLSFANLDDIPPLARKDGSSAVSWSRKVVSFYSLLSGAESMEGKLSSGVSCKIASGSSSTPEEKMVLAMVAEGFGLQQLDLLPIGVSLPLRHAVDKCRESPPTGWPATAYVLLGREDLALSCVAHLKKSEQLETQTNRHLISMSAPYMLHLQPVTIPSTVLDTIAMDTSKFDNVDSSDDCPIDGMEHLFNSSTQLRYGRDLRLNEVRRLLCSARPVAIQTSINPTASDQELQQAQLWQFSQRTTALPLGRGAFTLATSCTLLTEALTVPKLVLAGRLPAQQNATVNLDPNIRNLQELRAWPEFHNAVAAGLRLAPFQGRVSRTWIIYNRPEEPNAIHAGLLFALGLHGHLTVLTINDIFQYYNKGHESTTVGLMLGLAASYRGTMEPTMSKSFYVHLPARHPSSFPELEVPTVLQSAALMSLGLLFEGSAHPQTMQFLLAEIGRRSGGDNVLEREGYAVSAGFALGLVALGGGEDKFACMDTLVDRLFHYAGEKFDVSRQEKSLLTSVTDEHGRGMGQMLDGVPVNVDVTAPGAIIALALLFLKTESEVIVSRLSIPCTNFELQYLRPDFIMLRVIARNLIMWSRVKPTKEWVESQIPQIVKEGIGALGDERNDMDEVDEEAIVQAYVNIVAGACISLGLKYAGSRNANAQELLYNYTVYFLNEVMAGSGNLQTFRLLRFLRSRNSSDGQANFGTQMAVSLAIGFLFLGGGMRSFSSSKSAIAALLITLYPRFPIGTNDNRCHLQAYRHFYVLATEARWIQTVDVDTGLPVYAPLEITVKETEHNAETSFCEVTPCLLPERGILKSVRVCGPRYWPLVIELTPEDKPWWLSGDKNHPFNSGVLYIKRKVGACSYVDDPVGCQSLISRAMNKAFSLTSMRGYTPKINSEPSSSNVDHLVSTFSSDPSLIAFAQLCCDSSWNSRSDVDFQEFCLQVLFECVSKDRPALLQVYMSLYTMIRAMTDQVSGNIVTFFDSLFISSLKLVVAYNEALLRGRLSSSRDGIVQSNFLGSLRKRVEELFSCSHEMQTDLHNYLTSGKWPDDKLRGKKCSLLLSWYLQWFCVPSPSVIQTTMERLKPKLKRSSAAPLLRLVFPRIHVRVISEIDKLLISG
uniref:Anaphase-promoting complex subunit 1 n=1 Tax=Chenopodium quinoa TaxID=63459 RepID=A0A803M3V4_CHEQI